MNNISPKKKVPYSCSKSKLYEMYALDITTRQARNGINEIIRENRGLKRFDPVPRLIWNQELMEFIETYGLPRNYEF